MRLYLQKASKGVKYWLYKSGSKYGISTEHKDASDFALTEIGKAKASVVRQLAHYPKFIGFSIHSEMAKTSKRKSAMNTIGTIDSIVYKSADDGELYQHTFKSKPTLIASSKKKLEIVGGKYSITDRGIIG